MEVTRHQQTNEHLRRRSPKEEKCRSLFKDETGENFPNHGRDFPVLLLYSPATVKAKNHKHDQPKHYSQMCNSEYKKTELKREL